MSHLQLEIRNLYNHLNAPEQATRLLFNAIERSRKFPIQSGDLSIAFVDDARIAQVHETFMDDPSPTDVITFPADLEMASAGEIIVSVDHARKYADDSEKSFSRELSLYLVHGWLHLGGYNDRNEEERSRMHLAEKEALSILDQNSLTGNFRLKTH